VYALQAFDGGVVAGGLFTQAGGAAASYIAFWNGSAWSPLGSGTDGTVLALALYGGDLVVGGEFAHAGGVPAENIARWNGSSWAALGSGTNGEVHALLPLADALWVGGAFSRAGDKPSCNIARWSGRGTSTPEVTTPSLAVIVSAPNPFGSLTTIRYAIPATGRATLAVWDVHGRRVRMLADGTQPAGLHVVEWNGDDGGGRPAASGVYFCRLENEGRVETRKLVLIRE
jgi:hypothetical protein